MPPNTSHTRSSHDDNPSVEESLNRLIESTPYFDIEVPHTSLFEGAYKVVAAIFPNWQYKDIKFVQCKDGITNQCKFLFYLKMSHSKKKRSSSRNNIKVVRVTYIPTDFSVLVRAYGKGSELIIDRKQEVVVNIYIYIQLV